MSIPTEPIGSIPRPRALLDGLRAHHAGSLAGAEFQALYRAAVRDTIREFEATGAAEYIPIAPLGTTDDCGFSPFGDDVSTARATAFAKIRARVAGAAMAAKKLHR